MASQTIRLTVDVSPDMNELINKLAEGLHSSKAEVLRKAIFLLDAAARGKKQGLKLGLADPEQPLNTEIVGI